MPYPAGMKCRICGQRPRNLSNWNGVYVKGELIALTCPKCQSPQENAMAEENRK